MNGTTVTVQPSVAAFDRHRSHGHQVNYLARLFAQALRARIEPLGVVPGQFAQLLALYQDGPLTQNELCERVLIDQSTMAHTLKRMERDGLVKRERDERDRRQVKVALTQRAEALKPELVRAAQEINRVAMAGIEDEEVERFNATLAHLIANLEPDIEGTGATA